MFACKLYSGTENFGGGQFTDNVFIAASVTSKLHAPVLLVVCMYVHVAEKIPLTNVYSLESRLKPWQAILLLQGTLHKAHLYFSETVPFPSGKFSLWGKVCGERKFFSWLGDQRSHLSTMRESTLGPFTL